MLDDIRRDGLALQDSLSSSSSSSSSYAAMQERFKLCYQFATKCEHMAKLLDRRGYFAYAAEGKNKLLRDQQYGHYSGPPLYNMNSNVTSLILRRAFGSEVPVDYANSSYADECDKLEKIVDSGYTKGYTAMYHLCDFFTLPTDDEKFTLCHESVQSLCCEKTWLHSDTPEAFLEQIGDPLLAAYSALHVSYESDRPSSVTKVAMAIMDSDYGMPNMDYETFCHAVWKGAADICLKTSKAEGHGMGLVRTSTIEFQPSITKGQLFLGGISVSGSRFDGDGFYKTISGETACLDWIVHLVTHFDSSSYEYDEERRAWKKEEEDRVLYIDIYFCDPPKDTNFLCGIVMVPRDGDVDDDDDDDDLIGVSDKELRPSHAWFYTSATDPEYPAPAREATFV